jgi:hypothetical protein
MRGDEEVHGHDHIAVIAQESSPEPAGLLSRIEAPGISCSNPSTRPGWQVLPIGVFLGRRNKSGWRKHHPDCDEQYWPDV